MDFGTLGRLFRCNKEFSHKKIRMHDMSDTEYMICTYIYEHADCSQDDAAAALKMDKTTVGKALAMLEAENCVVRARDAGDKRIKRLRLTQTGQTRIGDILHIHNEWFSEIMTCLSPDEQKRFEDYCERLLAAAEKYAESNTDEVKENAR